MKSHKVKNEKKSAYPQGPKGEPATDDGSRLWDAIAKLPKKKVKK